MCRIVFWQNIISPHQIPFLDALSDLAEIMLIAERETLEHRLQEGWQRPNINPRIQCVVAPEGGDILDILSATSSAVHVFSGIDAYPMVYTALREATKRRLKCMVFAEPYRWHGVMGILRMLKYRYLFLRYGRYIHALLTTGVWGEQCYSRSGFPRSKIFQWLYFSTRGTRSSLEFALDNERALSAPIEYRECEKPRLLFVGRLDANKNIIGLLDVLIPLRSMFERFVIVGGGELEQELMSKVEGQSNVLYMGRLPNMEVQDVMRDSDILVLPSKYDGWGTVVNEALHAGMRVLASENCGAAILLDGEMRGETFRLEKEAMQMTLSKWLRKGRHSNEDRERISQWANATISGEAGAQQFLGIIERLWK